MNSPLVPALLGAAGGALAATLLLSLAPHQPAIQSAPPDLLRRLDSLTARVESLTAELARRTMSPDSVPIPSRERVDAEDDNLAAVAEQLSSLVTTLQGRSAPSTIRPPDLRERNAPARWEDLADLGRRAALDHPAEKRKLMLLGTADILARFGFPTDVYSHGNTLQLSYHREGMASAWFNFHDGLLVDFGADAQ